MEIVRRWSVLACAFAVPLMVTLMVPLMVTVSFLAWSAGSHAAVADAGPMSVRVTGTLLVARSDRRAGATSYAVAVGSHVVPVRGRLGGVRRSTPFRGRLAVPDSLTGALAARGVATTRGSVVDASSSVGRRVLATAVRDAAVLRVVGTPSFGSAPAPAVVPPRPVSHEIYVAAASNLGPIGLTDAQMLADASRVAGYWKHQANGAVTQIDVRPGVLHYRARAAQSDCGLGADFFGVVQEAATKLPGIDLSGTDQLVVFVPDAGSCSRGNVVGEGTVGDSFASGGAVVVRADRRIDATIAHEAGHNYGLEHANVRFHGRSLEYYGVYDVMGFSLPGYDQLTALSTPYRVAEGVTDPGEIADVDLGDERAPVEQRWTIAPRSADSGLRSVRVQDPDTGRLLYLDYRCGCGQDARAAYQAGLVLSHGRGVFRYRPGVVVTAARSGFGVDDLALPRGATSLAKGVTWRNGSGNLRVRVDSLGARARVTVDFTPGALVAPAPTPTITGAARVGRRLHAVAGTWLRGVTLRYQWFADGVAVPGATGATFTPTRRERGSRLRVHVTGRRAGYHHVTRTSARTPRVGRAVR